MWTTDEWAGCYPSRWKDLIVPAAMAHPAKFSSKLIRRIYDHLQSEGWVRRGDSVVDPFGGVALGGLDAMRLGLNWYGVELEEKFWKLGNENIELWNKKFEKMPRLGSARLLHGDSRKLLEVLNLGAWAVAVSSPPYGDGSAHTGGDDLHPERMQGGKYYGVGLAGVVSSPPYADSMSKKSGIDGRKSKYNGGPNSQIYTDPTYGKTPGQLGAMKAGGFDAAVSSPPFLQSEGGTGEKSIPSKYRDCPTFMARHAAGNKSADAYGKTEGQLEAAVSSPPYKTGGHHDHMMDAYNTNGRGQPGYGKGYADESPAQLGADDFWLAAREIVAQVYLALAPGGHAAWVVKDYVKNKQIVPFCDQWRQLCESVGFVTLHEHRASLVHGKQHGFSGEVKRKESKSFFRRLAEKNGSPRVDWDTVWCMEKPVSGLVTAENGLVTDSRIKDGG